MRRRPRTDGLPTARTALRTGCVRVLVFCNSCRHQADADLNALVKFGCGDVPLTELQFRCSQCGTDRTDFVVTARDNPQAVVRRPGARVAPGIPPVSAEAPGNLTAPFCSGA